MFFIGSLLVLCLATVAYGAPSRIVNGHDAPNHKYPYQVSLQDHETGHFCSGSILNEHWILTAAHCVDKPYPKNYTISVGTNFLNVPVDSYVPQFSVMHEKFVDFLYDDIALIRVVGKIVFNDFVKPIVLANEDLSDYSLPAIVAGWGRLSANGPIPNELKEIDLKLITEDQCKNHWFTTASHICTFTKTGEGVCLGDSGGPLLVGGVQVGITSYIQPCGVGYPDVFTRVWSFRNWINGTMQRFEITSE